MTTETLRRDDDSDLVLIVDYPAPELDGAEACLECAGSGMSADLYEQPTDGDEYLDELDDEGLDGGERCPSCGGREFNVVESVPTPEEIEAGPYGELLARARERGLTEWEITDAAAFGELDARFGPGAQALAEQADRQVAYLRMPCGCTEGRVRTVRRDELEAIA